MNLQLVLAAVIALIFLYFYLTRNLDYWTKRGICGPKPLPFLGNILDNLKSAINVVEVERVAKYGRIYGYFDFSQPILTIAEPELIEQICIKDFYVFPNHKNQFPSDPIFSKVLPFLKDDDWRRVRSITSSIFSTKRLKQMIPLIDGCMKNLIENLESIAGDEEIDPKIIFGAFTLEVIAKCVFKIELNGNNNPNHPFLVNVRKALNLRSFRVLLLHMIPFKFQKLLGCQIVSEDVLSYLRSAINIIIQEKRTKTDKNCKGFVELLMDAEISNEEGLEPLTGSFKNATENLSKAIKCGKKLNEGEILANCTIFLTAGYEMTSNLLNYCAYALAMNPAVQQSLFEELNDYFSQNSELEYASLNKLTYLDAFINETLRMYSILPHDDRIASIDYKLGDTGIILPKGTVINLPFYAIHHDQEFHPDPFVFKPERFLPENRDQIKPFTFIPFGCGPRTCIAQRFVVLEAKLVLSQVVYRFKFVKTAKTPEVPNFTSKKILLLCDPLYIGVEKR